MKINEVGHELVVANSKIILYEKEILWLFMRR
jgi:hypothetical protein